MFTKNLIPLILLIFVPITLIADFWHWNKLIIFLASAIAIIPLFLIPLLI